MADAKKYIPIKKGPEEEDGLDGLRISLVRDQRWGAQDQLMLLRERQIEENVRVLAGRHYDVWSEALGKFVDVTRYMNDAEKLWRQRPVINVMLYWYMLTHARLTENSPIITFRPSSADRLDAMLAEVSDTIFKTLWAETGASDALDRVMRWVVGAGYGYIKSRADYTKGPEQELYGRAVLSLDTDDGPIQRVVPRAPYDADGNPLAQLVPDEAGDYAYQPTGEAAKQREGVICLDVLSPLECRGEWNTKPWHQKAWHVQRAYLTPDEVWERYEVDVEPDVWVEAENGGYLERLLFGAGYFGSVTHQFGSVSPSMHSTMGLVCVDELWERPCRYTPKTETSAGGRLLCVTKLRVLSDTDRPFALSYTSPIRKFGFVELPGRPGDTTPLEMMAPINKSYNRGWGQLLEHRNKVTNPLQLIDPDSEINVDELTGAPGERVEGGMRNGVPMISYLAPPQISSDVWRIQELLFEVLMTLGNIPGAEGQAPTESASGELVSQLRFNSDRFIGPTARLATTECARMVEDWIAILPTIWTAEKVLTYAGDDSIVRTVTVLPHMFEGKVNVIPELESMLPESRQERMQRIAAMYEKGLFGDPKTPQARQRFLELARFPHLGRTALPGGVHRSTAEQNLGALLRGSSAEEIPLYDAYDFEVHLDVVENYIASPEFKTADPEVQQQIQLHRERIRGAAVKKTLDEQKVAGLVQRATTVQQATNALHGQLLTPPPASPEPGPPSAPPPGQDSRAA